MATALAPRVAPTVGAAHSSRAARPLLGRSSPKCRGGLRLAPPRPLALRSAPDRGPGPACRGSPRHTLRAHAPHVAGTSRGYSTALCSPRAGGKELCPRSAPHAGQGTPDAESRRGAPPRFRRRPRCSWSAGPRAFEFRFTPRRVVSRTTLHRGPAPCVLHLAVVVELARSPLLRLSLTPLSCSLSLSLSLSLSMRMRT